MSSASSKLFFVATKGDALAELLLAAIAEKANSSSWMRPFIPQISLTILQSEEIPQYLEQQLLDPERTVLLLSCDNLSRGAYSLGSSRKGRRALRAQYGGPEVFVPAGRWREIILLHTLMGRGRHYVQVNPHSVAQQVLIGLLGVSRPDYFAEFNRQEFISMGAGAV